MLACAPLRDAVEVACPEEEADEGAGGDEEANEESPECVAAKSALDECTTPCRETHRAAKAACRDSNNTCLAGECGLRRAQLKPTEQDEEQ